MSKVFNTLIPQPADRNHTTDSPDDAAFMLIPPDRGPTDNTVNFGAIMSGGGDRRNFVSLGAISWVGH